MFVCLFASEPQVSGVCLAVEGCAYLPQKTSGFDSMLVCICVFACVYTCTHAEIPEGSSIDKSCSQAVGTSQADTSCQSLRPGSQLS